MTNYGITASQEGIDLDNATDAQRAIDSRWRYMDILQEASLNLGTLTATAKIYEHKLGFVPAFDCYNLNLNIYMGGSVSPSGGDLPSIWADNQNVYVSNVHAIFGDPLVFNSNVIIRIYNVPITEEYTAPIAESSLKSKSSASKYGVKILNPDKSGPIDSNDLTKFSLNTRSKSLSIHKTGTQVANSATVWGLNINHGLNNPPIFMIASCATDKSYVYPINPQTFDFFAKADIPSQLSFRGVQSAMSGRYAYIIFKEFADFAL